VSNWLLQGDATAIPLADASVDVTIGSPPYAAARTYGVKADREAEAWSVWMADVTVECLRVTRGPVIWVVDDQVRKGQLRPGVFLLCTELYRRGVMLERPCIWRSNKAPSRHGRWWTHAWEYVLAFKRTEVLPYFDWKATATPPKWGYAGAFRQRRKDGSRPQRLREYVAPELAHPRDIFYAKVGGGHMGHPLAAENEAPYPESLVEQIIPVVCPPAGKVLDPFSGSGTTVSVARRLGRRGIGIDLRWSQCELGRRRLAEPPKAAKVKRAKPVTTASEPSLFPPSPVLEPARVPTEAAA
jgi:hypothetical protein